MPWKNYTHIIIMQEDLQFATVWHSLGGFVVTKFKLFSCSLIIYGQNMKASINKSILKHLDQLIVFSQGYMSSMLIDY